MTLDDIIKFIEEEDKHIIEKYGSPDVEKRILARMAKLTEETGELAEAVLSYLNDQRPEKIDKFEKEELENEIADVIIVALLIAKSTDTDIKVALRRKIDKVISRR